MVITSNGRPIAILVAVDESDVEESLAGIRRSRAVGAVAGMQRRSAEEGMAEISMGEIEREIEAVRARRSG